VSLKSYYRASFHFIILIHSPDLVYLSSHSILHKFCSFLNHATSVGLFWRGCTSYYGHTLNCSWLILLDRSEQDISLINIVNIESSACSCQWIWIWYLEFTYYEVEIGNPRVGIVLEEVHGLLGKRTGELVAGGGTANNCINSSRSRWSSATTASISIRRFISCRRSRSARCRACVSATKARRKPGRERARMISNNKQSRELRRTWALFVRNPWNHEQGDQKHLAKVQTCDEALIFPGSSRNPRAARRRYTNIPSIATVRVAWFDTDSLLLSIPYTQALEIEFEVHFMETLIILRQIGVCGVALYQVSASFLGMERSDWGREKGARIRRWLLMLDIFGQRVTPTKKTRPSAWSLGWNRSSLCHQPIEVFLLCFHCKNTSWFSV